MYTDLFKQLPRLEEVDLGYEVNDVFVKNKLQVWSHLFSYFIKVSFTLAAQELCPHT